MAARPSRPGTMLPRTALEAAIVTRCLLLQRLRIELLLAGRLPCCAARSLRMMVVMMAVPMVVMVLVLMVVVVVVMRCDCVIVLQLGLLVRNHVETALCLCPTASRRWPRFVGPHRLHPGKRQQQAPDGGAGRDHWWCGGARRYRYLLSPLPIPLHSRCTTIDQLTHNFLLFLLLLLVFVTFLSRNRDKLLLMGAGQATSRRPLRRPRHDGLNDGVHDRLPIVAIALASFFTRQALHIYVLVFLFLHLAIIALLLIIVIVLVFIVDEVVFHVGRQDHVSIAPAEAPTAAVLQQHHLHRRMVVRLLMLVGPWRGTSQHDLLLLLLLLLRIIAQTAILDHHIVVLVHHVVQHVLVLRLLHRRLLLAAPVAQPPQPSTAQLVLQRTVTVRIIATLVTVGFALLVVLVIVTVVLVLLLLHHHLGSGGRRQRGWCVNGDAVRQHGEVLR
uniref:Uncharacterized protein n=1 Tax=Anopheles atroparvus TaxID=41427 RepID=A0A182ITX7_ANOAO